MGIEIFAERAERMGGEPKGAVVYRNARRSAARVPATTVPMARPMSTLLTAWA